ncbi:MAG TPA: glycoside hydrolase family 66 protein [Symbiobacteriaceae bacterium]|nr:glycoside hydrolase family 66 protein [Symbiobacteriaceae bacterium]
MWPDKAQYRPGDAVTLHAPGASAVRISELGYARETVAVADGVARWTAPEAGAHAARGFRAEALDAAGNVVAVTAFDVARHWSVAPRYSFLSDFKPSDTAEAVELMNRLHLNVVQFYDWMYTHYQFFAETEEFVDPLGRRNSHKVVRERIEACHRHGMAALGYGAMYGGEKPVLEAHPEWQLYNPDGTPISLADLFFIQNFDRGCGWREQILGEFEAALTRLGFDGIHIDQYGFPKRGLYRPAPDQEQVVDVAGAMPGFVAEACERLARIRPEGGSMFNCVNNWPVELIAPLEGDATTYIEVWPPNETYADLHRLVRHARAAGPRKQVILSAYLHPFHREQERPEGSMNALRLTSAAVYASGGFHLLLGEGDGVLADAYYPKYGRLSAEDLAVVQRYYDFITAYGELLHDQELRDVSFTWTDGNNGETRYGGPVPCNSRAEAGTVWTIEREKAGRRVLHLVNLTGLPHTKWNAPQEEPAPVDGLTVEFQLFSPVKAVWCASPDDGGAPRRLEVEPVSGEGNPYVRVRVPQLRYWTMLWTEE